MFFQTSMNSEHQTFRFFALGKMTSLNFTAKSYCHLIALFQLFLSLRLMSKVLPILDIFLLSALSHSSSIPISDSIISFDHTTYQRFHYYSV